MIYINKEPCFFKLKEKDDEWIPYWEICSKISLKKIMIDQPAVPYIADGADIMRPGIVNVDDDIKENELVAVIDEKNKVIIAIGKALYNSEEIRKMEKGKVIKNIHHVGDVISKTIKK
ncbi:MAG: PUA domain-containing protein [Promethearchaeota archaeon]